MAAGDIMLKLLITGDATSALAAVGGLSRSFGSSGLTGALAGVAIGAAAVAVAIGVAAVKAAGDFQAQTERLVTSAGELQSNLGLVRSGLLQMSVDTATSTDQLAAGMYFIESAGYHAAAGLEVLKAAAMGAKSENADLDVVAKALTTEMVDYHMSASQAADAMNGLIAAVQNGKTNLQDLASSMGAVLPIASALGISFPQVAGAMDTMTNAGMSSRQAAMNLAHVLLSLSAPAKNAVKAMADVGLSAQGVKDALIHKGLPEALQMIEDAVGKKFPAGSVAYEQALKTILGGIMGVKLAAMLTGPSLATTEQNIQKITDAMKNGHGAVLGWTEVQSTFNFKMDQAAQAVHVLLITLGTALLPIMSQVASAVSATVGRFTSWLMEGNRLQNGLQAVGNAIKGISGFIGSLVSGIANVVNFFRQNQVAALALLIPLGMLSAILVQMAVTAIVAFIAGLPALIAGFIGWATAAGAAAIATLAATWPVLAIGAAIGALIAIIVLLVTHWGQVVSFLKGVWNAFASWFMGILGDIGSFFQGVWSAIANFFIGIWNNIANFATSVWSSIVNFIAPIWNRVSSAFHSAWNVILNILKGVWNVIKMAAFVIFSIIVAIIILPFVPLIKFFKEHWTTIQYLLVTVWNAIKNVAMTVWNAIVNFFLTIWNAVSSFFTTVWNAIVSFLTTVWNGIVSVATTIWTGISKFFQTEVRGWQIIISTVWNAITSFLSGVWNKIKGIASSVWNGIVSAIKGPIQTVMGWLSTAWDAIKQAFSNTMNALGGIAKSAWNGVSSVIKGAINGLIDIINHMIDGVNSVTGTIGIPSIPHIPHLAGGGMNLPAGMYWVGEMGPEILYIPQGASVLSNQQSTALVSRSGSYAVAGSRGGSGGGYDTANIVLTVDGRVLAQAVGVRLADGMRRQGGVRSR